MLYDVSKRNMLKTITTFDPHMSTYVKFSNAGRALCTCKINSKDAELQINLNQAIYWKQFWSPFLCFFPLVEIIIIIPGYIHLPTYLNLFSLDKDFLWMTTLKVLTYKKWSKLLDSRIDFFSFSFVNCWLTICDPYCDLFEHWAHCPIH